jgi:hypothetical protein
MIEKLIHRPLLINTNELCQLLELRLCTKETSSPEGVATVHYIRTFPITVGALKSIIASWEQLIVDITLSHSGQLSSNRTNSMTIKFYIFASAG